MFPVITSADNDKLKTIRKLQQKRWRTKLGLFSAEGEDLIGPDPELILLEPASTWSRSCSTR